MKLPEPPHLRELNRSDEQECHLVLAGWLRTYVCERVTHIPRDVVIRLCKPVVERLVADSQVVVACDHEQHDIVLGWVAFDGDVLHYVCVKPRWQRLGIASFLLADFMKIPVTYTHRTQDGMRLPVPESWSYAPMARFSEAA